MLSPILDRSDLPVGTTLPATIAASLPPAATYRSFPESTVTAETFHVPEHEFGTGSWLFARPSNVALLRTAMTGDLGRILVVDEAHHFRALNIMVGAGKSEFVRAWLASSFVHETVELTRLAPITPTDQPVVDPDEATRAALTDLVDWTGLSDDRLRQLLGAKSRSSFYNWLRGGPISDKFATRITRLHSLIRPIRETRDRKLVAAWLEHGDPSPADLVVSERWDDLSALAKAAVLPVRAAPPIAEVAEDDIADVESLLSLMDFAAAPAARAPAGKTGWRLREDTGLGNWSYEEA